MYKIVLLACTSFLLTTANAQTKQQVTEAKSFTNQHSSISVVYGVSTLLRVAPFIKSNEGIDNSGSFAVGPLSVLYNKGLSNHISLQFGPSVMFYRDKYRYETSGPAPDQANLILLGLTAGFNYHFATTAVVDPYVGGGVGVGYYTSSGGADQASLRLKGEVPILYSAHVGMNVYNRKNNAWTFEVGYDYLSYAKVGYTFVKHK
jgi:hypothetical protein